MSFVSHSTFLIATWIAAICGGVGIGAAFISAIVGYELGEQATQSANERIAKAEASAKADADAKIGIAREEAKADIAKSNAAIALARKETAAAQLELAKLKAPRNLTAEQSAKLINDLRKFDPVTYDIAYPKQMEPGSFLVSELIKVFSELGWRFISYEGALPKQEMSLIEVRSLPAEIYAEWPSKKFFAGETSQLIGIKIWRQFRASNLEAASTLERDLIEFGLYSESDVAPPPRPGETRSQVLHILVGSKQ